MLERTCSPEQTLVRVRMEIELERVAFDKWYGRDYSTAHLDASKLTGWSPEKTKAWEVWLARAERGTRVAAKTYPNPHIEAEPRTAHDYDLVHLALGLGPSESAIDPRDIPADTGHADIDKLIGRLCSADPDFEDCTAAAQVLRALSKLLLAGGSVSDRSQDREVSLPQLPTIDVGGTLKPQIWFSAKETRAYAKAAVLADREAAANDAGQLGDALSLLPLPEPVDQLAGDDGFGVVGTQDVFTGDQMRVYALANRRRRAGGASAALKLLGPTHTSMQVDYRGLFDQARLALRSERGVAELLRQLEGHLTELGTRWYAGDVQVVDELLQLYCIERDARQALAAPEPTHG